MTLRKTKFDWSPHTSLHNISSQYQPLFVAHHIVVLFQLTSFVNTCNDSE